MIGLPLGATVPSFAAEDVGGATFTEADLRGSTSVVLFLGSSCGACERFVRDLQAGGVPELGARLVTVAIDSDSRRELSQSAETVVVDENRSVARAFESNLVPQTFIVDEHGTVLASGRPNDWDGVRHLVATAKGGDRQSDVAAAAI